MFRLLTACLVIVLLACNTKNQTSGNTITQDSSAIVNDPKNNLNIQVAEFSEVDTSGIIMFPLRMGESAEDRSSFSYKSMPDGNYWNIVFLNSKTGEYHLLSDQKMLINSYSQGYTSSEEPKVSSEANKIFYSITTDDINADKILDHTDPAYLFISDKDGQNLRLISPKGGNVQNWKLIKSSGKVIMAIKRDTDKNAKFDDKDEITSFVFDLTNPSETQELFYSEFKNKLKVLYDKDWKRKKK